MQTYILAGLGVFGLILPVAAADNVPSARPSHSNELVCRAMTSEGNVTHTECHTRSEWDSMRQVNQQAVRQVQARAQQSTVHMGMTGLGHGH